MARKVAKKKAPKLAKKAAPRKTKAPKARKTVKAAKAAKAAKKAAPAAKPARFVGNAAPVATAPACTRATPAVVSNPYALELVGRITVPAPPPPRPAAAPPTVQVVPRPAAGRPQAVFSGAAVQARR